MDDWWVQADNYVMQSSENSPDFFTYEPEPDFNMMDHQPGSSFGVMASDQNAPVEQVPAAPVEQEFDLVGVGKDWLGKAFDFVKTAVTTPETVDKEGNVTKGGGLNDLSKMILAGAIQSYGQGQVMKWQQERAEKESARTRQQKREDRDEQYSRKPFGTAPQLAPSRGLVKGGV